MTMASIQAASTTAASACCSTSSCVSCTGQKSKAMCWMPSCRKCCYVLELIGSALRSSSCVQTDWRCHLAFWKLRLILSALRRPEALGICCPGMLATNHQLNILFHMNSKVISWTNCVCMCRAKALRARLAKVLATVIILKEPVPDGNANDETSVGAPGASCLPTLCNSGRQRSASVGESAASYAENSSRLSDVESKDIETAVCPPATY